MTYEEFIEAMKTRAHEELGFPLEKMKFCSKGLTSEDPEMIALIRDTNARYTGKESDELLLDILIMEKPGADESHAFHRIAMERMFETEEKDGFEAAFSDILNAQKNAELIGMEERVKERTLEDYEKIRSHLILRPLNRVLHRLDLKGCVYKKIGDIALVLYQLLGDVNAVLLISRIRKEELLRWGMEDQEEKILQDALENTARLYPACVYNFRKGREEDFLKGEFSREDIGTQFFSNTILLSTFRTVNGAAAMFYPGAAEKMMKIMGGPFVAVFMNVNDVMIFEPGDRYADKALESAGESSQMGEMLSCQLYYYDGEKFQPGITGRIDRNGKATVSL